MKKTAYHRPNGMTEHGEEGKWTEGVRARTMRQRAVSESSRVCSAELLAGLWRTWHSYLPEDELTKQPNEPALNHGAPAPCIRGRQRIPR